MKLISEAHAFDFLRRIHLDESGCWLWEGFCGIDGYGTISIRKRPHRVHRLSWELHYGSIPDGLYVLHRCDVRNCLNPAHLFLGTAKDNIQDMYAKGRAPDGRKLRPRDAQGKLIRTKTRVPKLSAEEVACVRDTYASGDATLQELAEVMKVSVSHIWQTVHNKIYV